MEPVALIYQTVHLSDCTCRPIVVYSGPCEAAYKRLSNYRSASATTDISVACESIVFDRLSFVARHSDLLNQHRRRSVWPDVRQAATS